MSVKILLAGTVKDMTSFEPGRFNQVYRNDLADALRHIADQISNNGSREGSGIGRSGLASLNFRLELEPVEKPTDEAA